MTGGQRLGVVFTVAMAALGGYNVGAVDLRAAVSVLLVWAIIMGVAVLTDAEKPSERVPALPPVDRVKTNHSVRVERLAHGRLTVVPDAADVYDWAEELSGA